MFPVVQQEEAAPPLADEVETPADDVPEEEQEEERAGGASGDSVQLEGMVVDQQNEDGAEVRKLRLGETPTCI